MFVFDEPSIGLHPADVQVLLRVFEALLDSGATVIVIEHDLDVIRNGDFVIDMGPGGGEAGGQIVAVGTPGRNKEKPKQHHRQIFITNFLLGDFTLYFLFNIHYIIL